MAFCGVLAGATCLMLSVATHPVKVMVKTVVARMAVITFLIDIFASLFGFYWKYQQ